MSLKILCAGCSMEERAVVEAGVRAGLGDRPRRDPWTVSLVKFGNGWSVTLDGPTVKGHRASFMVPGPQGVAEAVRSAADPSGAPPSAASSPASGRTAPAVPQHRRDSHKCGMCGGQYVLLYDAEPDEPLEDAPVACPHCWQILKVQVARSVSFDRDYRADKV